MSSDWSNISFIFLMSKVCFSLNVNYFWGILPDVFYSLPEVFPTTFRKMRKPAARAMAPTAKKLLLFSRNFLVFYIDKRWVFTG